MKSFVKRYRISLLLVIVLCMLLSSCGLLKDLGIGVSPDVSSEITQETSSDGEPLNHLSGTVAYATLHTITILAKTGETYTFEKDTEKLDVGKDGVLIGCPATVDYYGVLDEALELQQVRLKRITVGPAADTVTEEARARQILSTMSLEEKVGQMFIVRCPKEDAAQAVANYHLGGYILFASDFKNKTKSEVTEDIQSYQNASPLGMLIGVDEEGGTVNRVSLYQQFRAVPFWSPQDLYIEGGWDLIVSDTKEKAELLKSLGINLNMAPVCDVPDAESDYIYPRSFGKDAALTAQYVEKVVATMNENSLGSVLKHFPGYGNNVDTHTGVAHDSRDYERFVKRDFLPFAAGIEAGADAVLVSHNIVACMDAESPASLSAKVHDILRKQLHFTGVIMTDDLYMDAIREFAGDGKAAVMAVQAGNDMVCCTDFEAQIPAVIDAAKNGTIPESTLDNAVMRVLRWKLKLGIIQ